MEVIKINAPLGRDFETVSSICDSLKILNTVSSIEWARDPSRFRLYVLLGADKQPLIQLYVMIWKLMPYFTLVDFRSLQPSNLLRRSDLNHLFESVFSDMHSDNRFTFYYATRERTYQSKFLQTEMHLAPVKGLKIFERYDMLLEGIVTPGQETRFASHSWLANPFKIESPYWIKRCTLKSDLALEWFMKNQN